MAGKSLDELEGFWLAVAMGWPIVVPMSLALLVLVPIGAIVGALPALLLAGCCCACEDFWELGPHPPPKHKAGNERTESGFARRQLREADAVLMAGDAAARAGLRRPLRAAALLHRRHQPRRLSGSERLMG